MCCRGGPFNWFHSLCNHCWLICSSLHCTSPLHSNYITLFTIIFHFSYLTHTHFVVIKFVLNALDWIIFIGVLIAFILQELNCLKFSDFKLTNFHLSLRVSCLLHCPVCWICMLLVLSFCWCTYLQEWMYGWYIGRLYGTVRVCDWLIGNLDEWLWTYLILMDSHAGWTIWVYFSLPLVVGLYCGWMNGFVLCWFFFELER